MAYTGRKGFGAAVLMLFASSMLLDMNVVKNRREGFVRRDLSPSDSSTASSLYAIVQFDSRPTNNDTYWNTAALWNWLYAQRHGHQYVMYTLKDSSCLSHDGQHVLANPWCKVKTMLQVQEDLKTADFFLYLDSDAVISKQFANQSMSELQSTMKHWLNWNLEEKPIVFNQDGPCWWCDTVKSKTNYTSCLNAGTVFWHRSQRATAVLKRWWESSTDPYEGNPLEFRFRDDWPWEQDRQMAIANANDELSTFIQIASQPEQMHLDMDRGHTHWCLSHLEQSNCFVSHYCEDAGMKEKMNQLYRNYSTEETMQSWYNEGTYTTAYLSMNSGTKSPHIREGV